MRFCITIIFLIIINILSLAQNIPNCLSASELLTIQSLSSKQIDNYLKNKGSSPDIEDNNQTIRYFGYNLEYSTKIWKKRNTGYFDGKLFFYFLNGKPSLVVYQTLNDCFENLKKEQPINARRKSENSDYLAYSFGRENGMLIDFRNFKTDNHCIFCFLINICNLNIKKFCHR
jgi:hypothetical protein